MFISSYLRKNQFFQNLNIMTLLILLFLSFSILPTKSFSQENTISSIVVDGNKRITSETIIAISKVEIGTSYNPSELNSALQLIKKSTFFKTVTVSFVKNVLIINVVENPTINTINFEGNSTLQDENLSALISSSERQTLSVSKAEKDADIIASAYADTGRISASVSPKIIELLDNRVDLIFEISEGRITEVEKITFSGNRIFSDIRLKGVIATKQAGIFRRFIKSDTYIEDKLDYDLDRLKDFYINKGYIDFEVKTSVKLTRAKDAFLINYSIKEGQKYNFSEISFNVSNDKIVKNSLIKLNRIKTGSSFDRRRISKLVEEIDIYLTKEGFNFIEPIPVISRNDAELTMDVEIQLQKKKKIFVERIEVEGNSTTLDEVIRLQFDFVEGDPFNRRKILEAVDKIRGLGFFSNVETDTREGSSPEQIIIEVKLTEKPTGSLGIGAGFNSSDGSVFTFNVNERNFLGKGQTIKLDLSTSKIERQTAIGFEDPSFLGRNLLAGISFGQTNTTPSSTPLKTEKMYFSPIIGFPLSRDSNLSIKYRLDQDEIKLTTLPGLVSPLIRSDVGSKNKSALIFSYKLDKTNSIISPTAGYDFLVTQEFSGLGGNVSFSKSEFEFKTYKTVFRDDIILSSNLSSGAIVGSGANIMNRFSLGGDRLKGFRNQGIGPYDTIYKSPLGGKMFTSLSLQASFPIGVPEEYGIFGGLFLDTGSLWGLDNAPSRIDDSANIRSAVGVSIFWDTVIGPLRFNWSRPIKRETYDVIENFRFTVDTRF
ncbi:outer membrane protein assembly factor BamA [Amylibacter sp.]|nr:outer membrane protein assembly factor BamA [Amylibacter sp.]MDC1532187.1 outer membrane protein assembly factor BamA [Amylibacter sp.]